MYIKVKKKKKTGRKLLQIDPEKVAQLAGMLCTSDEIAAVLDCSKDTLEKRFSAIMKKGRECGKVSLKRAQFVSAIRDKNITMQIWLGKQYLHQRNDPISDENCKGQIMEWIERMSREPVPVENEITKENYAASTGI